MDKQELRRHAFDVLRKTPQTHFHAVENEIRQRMEDFGRSDVLTLHEVLWDLLLQGVLAPGKNSLNLHLPFVHVTEHGARCLEEGGILAHDPDGYVAHLASCGASETICDVAREANLCYLAGRNEAAAILLARAMAAVLNHLRDGLIQSGRQQGRGTRSLAGAETSKETVRAAQRALASRSLPDALAVQCDAQLCAAAGVIDADTDPLSGPLPQITPARVLASLLLLPDFCRFVYAVLDQLGQKEDAA